MSYQPIYDGEFDLAIDPDDQNLVELLKSVVRHKLIMTGWVTDGPAGGNPMITLRGTRRQFMGWLNDYYDADQCAFPRMTGEPLSEAEVWANAMDTFNFKFVA